MANNRLILILAVSLGFIIIGVILIGSNNLFQGEQSSTDTTTTTTSISTTTNTTTISSNTTSIDDSEPPTVNEKRFSIEGTEFSFSESSISVNKGDKVIITFTNGGNRFHNFGIPDLNIRTAIIPAGGIETLEFIVDETGEFNFDCSIPGHREAGMLGRLIVNEP